MRVNRRAVARRLALRRIPRIHVDVVPPIRFSLDQCHVPSPDDNGVPSFSLCK